ncbi:MAG TPA: hypothetical protein DCS93_08615 [Microscillaceae bacterium]|nr:hypothetical protein [Microscillaceae bacterium]
MENHLKEIAYNQRQYKKLIKKALKKEANKGFTIHDIVVATGLSPDWISHTLPKLIKEYPCRLETNEKNELVYIFDFENTQNRFVKKVTRWLEKRKSKPNLFRQLVAYVFGVSNQLKDQWFTEKIILHYLRSNNGKIVTAELVQLTGWSIRQAETEAVQLLANYNGEVDVTPEGIIMYCFDDLAEVSDENEHISESLKIWERPVPERELNENEVGVNEKLKKLNQWNLRLAGLAPVVVGGLFYFLKGSVPTDILLLSAGLPISLSTLFYTVPAIRKLRLSIENERIRRQNVERYVLKAIFHRIHQQIRPEKHINLLIDDVKPKKNYLYWWNPKVVDQSMFDVLMMLTCTYDKEAIFKEKAFGLQANMDVDNEGEICYDFDRLNLELETVNQYRLLPPRNTNSLLY